jgi:hypothetical protein
MHWFVSLAYALGCICCVVCCAGLVAHIPQEFYNFLLDVQTRMAKVIRSVGKIDHASYPFLYH